MILPDQLRNYQLTKNISAQQNMEILEILSQTLHEIQTGRSCKVEEGGRGNQNQAFSFFRANC